MDPLAIEAAVAAIGLESILSGEPTFYRHQIDTALKLPKKIRAELRAFYAADGFEKASPLPKLDYHHVLDLLDRAGQPHQAEALIAAVEDQRLAAEMSAVVTRIVSILESAIPRRQEQSLVGAVDVTPDRESLARFRALWVLASDPMRVLTEMREGQLDPESVQRFAALWPATYAAIVQAEVDARVAAKAARGKRWQPSSKKTRQVLTLQQTSTFDPGLAGAVATAYAESGAPKSRPLPSVANAAQQLTPAQRAESRAT